MRHTVFMVGKNAGDSGKDKREERLAKQLRANLARRKAQARALRSGAEDSRPEGLDTARDLSAKEPGGGEGAGD